jgi:DNA replication licensing factor MCM6
MASPAVVSSEAGFMTSERSLGTPRAARLPGSSSGRPAAPPSESLGGLSDGEGEGFADDQVPVRARPTDPSNIPRVEDRIGLIIQQSFEDFIEGYV